MTVPIRMTAGAGGAGVPDWTLEQLAAIRGALWTVKGTFQYGPRPGQPDNIGAIDYFESYDADGQHRLIDLWHEHGYTHAPVGPHVDPGYHGQYPAVEYSIGGYVDAVLLPLWAANIAPVYFVKPDAWSIADLKAHTDEFRLASVQQAARIVVPGGWEPSMANADWIDLLQWAAETFPDALRLVHMEADHDAPGTHEDVERMGGTGPLWATVAPFVHGWLVQNGAFGAPPIERQQAFNNFIAQFNPGDPLSLVGRFETGYAGWPMYSAWGNDRRLKVYAGEFASYWVYWDNRPESEARAWGSAAIRAGADGVLDGGF